MIVIIPALCCAILGHGLPDGSYDRGIQVLVFPGTIEVNYELTANDATLRKWTVAHGRTEIEQLQPLIANGLQIEIDGVPQRLIPRVVRREKRHHAKAIFTYELPYVPGGTCGKFVLRDNNFRTSDGSLRLAIVGRDGARVMRSDAAINLRRASPCTLQTLSAAERAKATCLTATLTVSSPPTHRHIGYEVPTLAVVVLSFLLAFRGRWRQRVVAFFV